MRNLQAREDCDKGSLEKARNAPKKLRGGYPGALEPLRDLVFKTARNNRLVRA